MKKILSKIRNKVHQDNRGMSLVEILCAVAILALISGVIGSVIVISTRTYSRGISETGVQQEAQLAANNIGDIVKDACGVIYGVPGEQYKENGEPMYDNEGNSVENTHSYTELSIITNDAKQYSVKYYAANKELKYEVLDNKTPSESVAEELLAENITQFEADTSSFKDSKSIKLKMTVKDGDREIPMEYTMTSRNGVGAGVAYTPITDSAAIIMSENEVVLVPGEEYKVEFSVLGDIAEGDLQWDSSTGFEVESSLKIDESDKSDGSAKVKVPIDTTEKKVDLWVKAVDESGATKAQGKITVYVRKVEQVKVNYTVNTEHATGGMMESAGAAYTFSASVTGNSLSKGVAYDYDNNYKIAQAVVWSFQLYADGRNTAREWECTQNALGQWEFTHSYSQGSESDFNQYFDTATLQEVEDAVLPQLTMTLKQDMPADFRLTVRATSKHALGVNKANSRYSEVYYGEEIVTPRSTLVNSPIQYVLLEPTETATVDVKVLGAGMSRVDTVSINYDHEYQSRNGVEYPADSRSDQTGTKAEYNYDATTGAKTVTITVGKDEKGHKEYNSGIGADVYDYNVYVNLTTSAGDSCTIIVCISRIDVISLEAEHPASSSGAEKDLEDTKDTTRNYRFSVRFNTDLEHKYLSLMRYLTPDEEKAKRNLATKLTITYTDTKTGTKLASDQAIIDGDGNVLSGKLPDKTGPNKDYSIIVTSSIGSAAKRDDTNGSGYQYINPSSTPHVFVSLRDETLPANRRLTIRAEAMHPTGGQYTNSGVDSYTTVEPVEKSIESSDLEVDSDVLIVEPGQGLSGSAEKLLIPIYVADSKIDHITAAISDCSDSNTKVVADPYVTTTKKDSKSVWYLSLQIGKDETGKNNTGLFDVVLRAYDKDNKQLNEKDGKKIQLAMRRVNEVDLMVSSGSGDINKENKANNQVTLQAYPKGYGTYGTQYFAEQSSEYGAYKLPYPMKWTMLYNGSEKELKNWTDYFSKVNDPVTNENDGKQGITVTLKKALPRGAIIRARSLHALGTNSSTRYNKSGLQYGDVCGELVIKGNYVVADGFQRADDWDFASDNTYTDWNKSDIPLIRQTYFSDAVYNSTQRTFFRYREAGTDWNATNKQYRMMDSEGEKAAFFSGDLGSRLFLPNKEYELEIVNVVYGTGPQGQKVIYWPQDDNLLEAGNGWAEEGYKLWDGTWGSNAWVDGSTKTPSQIYEIMKSTAQVPHDYLIPKSTIYFDKVDGVAESIDGKVKTIGSESNPRILKNVTGTDSNDERHFAVRLTPTSFNIEKTQAHFTAKIDKWENSSWVLMEALTQSHSLDENTYYWFMQVSVPKYDIYHIRPYASGKYRIRATVTGMTWTKITGGLFATGSNRYQNYVVDNIDLFDMSDESGVMYLQLN